MHVKSVKSCLWFLFGIGLTVIGLRILHGPGSVVALTDMMPWGLWKGGGVVALVPIGGAGFTIAALVSIFHWKRYKPLYFGAVLLGLMCYSSVAIGLSFDIGIWWRIVFPLGYWQFHSTLFEIAWCIMLYLGVLTVEFSHVVAERLDLKRTVNFLHKFGIVFVIAGICLSTLHQSSLGTLFLATPYRLHPLWYTDILPFFFFVTSIGLGCLTISWVALVAHWLYGTEPPMDAISGLGRIAAFALGFYGLVRFAQILIAGHGGLLFEPGWDMVNFWIEILLSAVLPVALLSRPGLRESRVAMFWIGTSALVGVSLNRVNVAGLATVSTTHDFYLPAWPEWATTIGILAGAGLVFLFCVEHFNVFERITRKLADAAGTPGELNPGDWKSVFFQNPYAEARVYSACFVLAVGAALVLMPEDAVFGVRPMQTPTHSPRLIAASTTTLPGIAGVRFSVAPVDGSDKSDPGTASLLMIDGNRDGDYVMFDHKSHATREEKRAGSCLSCHHMRKPYEDVSGCSGCHSDMYLTVDIFDHEFHTQRTKGNEGCVRCHTDPGAAKVRQNVKSCHECHKRMRPEGSLVRIAEDRQRSDASGYMHALHGLCIECHKREESKLDPPNENFARCTHCHRHQPRLAEEEWEARL